MFEFIEGLIDLALRPLFSIMMRWAVPIIGAALFSSIASVVIAANPVVGAVMILIAAILLVTYRLHQGAVWQAVMWGLLLVPYGALAALAPNWSILWGLVIDLLALGVIALPGAVLPHGRALLTAAIMTAVGLHTALAVTVWSHGVVFLTVLGLIAVVAGSAMFSRGARPWEVRRAQRQAGRLAVLGGLALIVLGLIAPRLSMPSIHVSVPEPIASMWDAVTNRTEAWATASRRALIGERAKTNALSELETDLQRAHKARWQRATQRIPDVPLAPREWQDLGVEQDP